MNIVKVLGICAALWGATANLALAQHGGFSGHGGGFAGHGGYSSGHSGSRGAYHGGGWGGHPGGYGNHWHGGWYSGWYGGVYVDPWWVGGAYPYYAYPDVEVAPAAPVYVEPNGAIAAPQGDWYYCQNPAGYYPYVKSCNGTWQQVPAQPPAQ